MIGESIRFEWFVGEERYWGSLRTARGLDISKFDLHIFPREQYVPREERVVAWLLRSGVLLAVALIIITSSSLLPRQVEHQRIVNEIERLLEREELAWRNNDRARFAQQIAPEVQNQWLSEWRDLWRIDQQERLDFGTRILQIDSRQALVTARAVVTRPALEWWETSPYWERRYYRAGAGGWLRTVPPTEFWGSAREMESDHLRFEYFAQDARFVEPLVADLETHYQTLSDLLTLRPPTQPRKLRIVIAPSTRRGWSPMRNRMDVTSPYLARIPVGLREEAYLTRIVTEQLVSLATSRAMLRYGGAYIYRWGMMTWALRGWLANDLLGEKSPWDRYAAQIFREYNQDRPPLHLTDITSRNLEEQPDRRRLFWQYVAAESMVAYTVETHGRQHIPYLLRSMGLYDSWEELIAGQFELSVEEFEEGWNLYINEQP